MRRIKMDRTLDDICLSCTRYEIVGDRIAQRSSQTLAYVRITRGFIQMQIAGPRPRVLESEVLQWDPKACISNKLPGDLMLLVPGPHFEKHWHCSELASQAWVKIWFKPSLCATFHGQVTQSF